MTKLPRAHEARGASRTKKGVFLCCTRLPPASVLSSTQVVTTALGEGPRAVYPQEVLTCLQISLDLMAPGSPWESDDGSEI